MGKTEKKLERGPRVGNGDEKNGGSKGAHNGYGNKTV